MSSDINCKRFFYDFIKVLNKKEISVKGELLRLIYPKPEYFDLTKCPEYESLIYQIAFLKIRPKDLTYPYNMYYTIEMEKDTITVIYTD